MVPSNGSGTKFFEMVEAESPRDPRARVHLQKVLRKFGAPGGCLGVWIQGSGCGSGLFETVEAESTRDPGLLLHLQEVVRKL